MDGGDVRYASNAGISIAYQVFGSGPRDLVFVCGTMSHLELWWGDPLATEMLERLGRFARVILFDKPGTGLSDPIPGAPTVDQRTDDVVAVMDVAGSARAVVVGFSEGGYPALRLAATQPHRVEAMVLLSALVCQEWSPAVGLPKPHFDAFWAVLDEACAHWGDGILMTAFAPTLAANRVYARLLSSIERTCMSPGMARSILQGMHDYDERETAAAVRVPTLVLHADESFVSIDFGRDLAARIDGSVFVQLAGPDHLPWIHNADKVPALIETFLTGVSVAPTDDNRVMTTIVFTDICDSTRRLAEYGDGRWSTVLAEHDRRMDDLLDRFGGEAVKHTGDGRMATFARPARAVRFAEAMTAVARSLGLEVRVGVHTGECELVGADVIGLAVNIAARVAALARPGEVLASSTVRDLVMGSGLAFVDRGRHELKGVPGEWSLLACTNDAPGPLVQAGYDTDVRHEVPGNDRPALRLRDRALLAGTRQAPGVMRRLWGVAKLN